MIRPFAPAVIAGLVPLLAGPSAFAQDDGAFDRTPQRCISVSRIDEVEAIDDQNLLFRMRGKQVLRNHLPRSCPGLQRENRISYKATGGRLCNVDTITVLEDRIGRGTGGTVLDELGFRETFTCRLGEFVPLSPAEVEEIEAMLADRDDRGRRRGRARAPVQTTEVELESEDETAETEPEADDAPAEQ